MQQPSDLPQFISAIAGAWAGPSSLWMEPGTPVHESHSTAKIGGVAGGRVLGLNYEWTFEDQRQDGRLLVALEDGVSVHMVWCDSFHTDAKIMDLTGEPRGTVLAATGSYSVPGSEVWGWRIELEHSADDALQLRMYNILPASMGGLEVLAVQTDYARA